MNSIINNITIWLQEQGERIRTWWSTNHVQVEENLQLLLQDLSRGINRVCRNITRLILIGIIINVVASYFYPEFPERFPVIYGWFDGWLQLGEFAVKAVLHGIYSLFTGEWNIFWSEYTEAFHELCQQFVEWLRSLHF